MCGQFEVNVCYIARNASPETINFCHQNGLEVKQANNKSSQPLR